MKKNLLVLALVLISSVIMACNIDFEIQGTAKTKYKIGDEVVVKVKIHLTHRVCPIAMKDTKLDAKGLEILGATDWKEVEPGSWERKVKMKVTGSKNGKLQLTATRTCDKEGGLGTLTLLSE